MRHIDLDTKFKKGRTPWNKGLKGTHFGFKTEFKKGQFKEEEHPSWKGEKAGYLPIHQWVKRHKGKPSHCEICGDNDDSKRYEWANIKGKTGRDLDNWFSLCITCHRRYDSKKLNKEKVIKIRQLYKSGVRQLVLAKKYLVDQSNISYIVRGITWQNI